MKIKRPHVNFLEVINLPQNICMHMLGENHHIGHRMSVGVIIMIVGVSVSKFHTEIYFINIFIDGFGYMIHAIGAIPVIEYVTAIKSAIKPKEPENQE